MAFRPRNVWLVRAWRACLQPFSDCHKLKKPEQQLGGIFYIFSAPKQLENPNPFSVYFLWGQKDRNLLVLLKIKDAI